MPISAFPAPPPFATATQSGLVSTGTQTLGGQKTFSGKIVNTLPIGLAQYTTAGLPSAASHLGSLVYDTTAGTFKYSNGSSWLSSSGTGDVTGAGSGAAGRLAFWTSSSAIASDSLLYWDDGANRLGIGTGSPAQALDVVGSLQFSLALMPSGSAGTSGQVLTSAGTGAAPTWTTPSAGLTGTGSSGAVTFWTGTTSLSEDPTQLFWDNTNNRLGIGTATPAVSLAVVGAITATSTVTGSNLSGTNTGDVTLAAIGATPNANGASLSGQALNLQPASASFGGVVTTGTQTLTGAKTFDTSVALTGASGNTLVVDTTTLVADATNNRVGIGTASPAQALDVVGNLRFSLALMPNGTAGTSGQVLTSAGSGAAPTWTTPSSGTVTGTGSSGALAFWTGTSSLSEDPTQLFWDNTNNRLGIGTASPSKTLEVSGDAKFSGDFHIAGTAGNYFRSIVTNPNVDDTPAVYSKLTHGTANGVTELYGTVCEVDTTGASQVADIFGLQSIVSLGSSTSFGDIRGIITNVSYDYAGTGTRMMGIEIASMSNAGTVSEAMGLRIRSQDGVATSNYQIYSDGTNPFVVKSTGAVGIGTAAPTAGNMLEVVGQVKVGGKVVNVTNPTAAQDAATKNYVDTKTGFMMLSYGLDAGNGSFPSTKYVNLGWVPEPDANENTFEVPAACRAAKLRIRAGVAPTGDNHVFTVRKNGSDTAVTATLLNGNTTASDTSNSVTFAAGDEISLKITNGASMTAPAERIRVSLMLTLD